MAPSRRKGASKAAAAAAALRQWKIGDLVLAKVKGFPAWPATVSEPEKWGYSTDWKKVLVYFFGTQQIAFCNPADVEEFNEVKKESLLVKRRGKGADFVRAVNEIIDCYEKLKKQSQDFSANCNQETIESNENNSAESLSESETKDEASAFTVKSPLKMPLSAEATSDLNFLTEAAVAAAAEDALHDEAMRLEEAGDNLVATDMPMSTSYYTRSKSEVALPRKGVGQRTFAQRSKSSSKIDPNRLQNCMFPSSNSNRSSRRAGNNALWVRSLRRSRRIMKSFDDSDRYYTDSPLSVSNDSIEEEDSGTVTVDSDTLSFNQGSNVDPGCKPIQPESVAENHEAETEVSDRLDFQTNTGMVKRKRMPNRKRLSNDTAESEAKLDKVVFEADMLKAEHVLRSDDEKHAERYTKEDGDEHLPLVKRARVRMGRLSPAGEEKGNLMHTEAISDISRSLRIQPSGWSLNYKEGDSAEQISVCVEGVEGDTDNPPLSNTSPAKKPHIWEARKNFVDGEAALPPSKRLHRALEAMSANAVEKSQTASEYPSTVTTSIEVYCSSEDCSEKVENLCNNVSEYGTSEFSVGLNLEMSENNANSFAPVADCIKPSCTVDISNSESCNLYKPAEGADRKESSLNEHSAEFDVSETNLKLEPPNLDEKPTSVDCNNCSLDLFTRPTDGCKTECSLLVHMSSDAAIVEETTVGSSQNDPDMHVDSMDGKGDESSKSQHFSLAETNQDSQLSENDQEAGSLLKDSNAMAYATPVEVIIGCHHQHLSHSNSISDDRLEDKTVPVPHSSSPLTDGLDDKSLTKSNSLSSPDVQLHLDKAKRADKLSTKGEADVALSSFEAILGSLTRTKETIVRATRIAIECAKFGFANKVVEILAHNLENESRLHRKVDLFFLVDSITQCSRGMKGDGGIYPSAVQALLPRLLLAAAPPSSSCHENHRQCLKVLRVWQERKIIPEPLIRHHIQELDALCGSYSSWASSRRPLRNERAFDDPIREMEGMLVDEYGSNSSIQLPGFCMPPMLRDEDGGSDSDGESFEAVTPEHNTENVDGNKTLFPVVEKHSHILKDVDGELEMEDVAPSCEAEISSTSNITGVDSAQTPHHQSDNHFWAPFAPAPREGIQRTSLPRSSPPQPPCPHPPPRQLPPDSIFKGPKSKSYPSSQNVKSNSQESVANHSIMSRGNPTSDMQHRASRQMPDCTNSSSFRGRPVSHPPIRASNSIQPPEGALNKSFHLRPPHPSPSNQFLYVRDQRVQSRRDVAPPSHPNRFHTQNEENVNVYRDRDRLKFPRRDSIGECWRPPLHSVSGPCYPDGARMSHAPMSYTGPHEPALHNNRWDYPRPMNHRQFISHRQPSEGPIPVANRGSNCWRPR
ncbi:HUA2-like protein 2 [Forsythia ovata]|uniref:HUA2-like protein 2 n=1 Tax=Forsythia ovata TaxID=205694 RepID=A0ABD1VE63_9LAMI